MSSCHTSPLEAWRQEHRPKVVTPVSSCARPPVRSRTRSHCGLADETPTLSLPCPYRGTAVRPPPFEPPRVAPLGDTDPPPELPLDDPLERRSLDPPDVMLPAEDPFGRPRV